MENFSPFGPCCVVKLSSPNEVYRSPLTEQLSLVRHLLVQPLGFKGQNADECLQGATVAS